MRAFREVTRLDVLGELRQPNRPCSGGSRAYPAGARVEIILRAVVRVEAGILEQDLHRANNAVHILDVADIFGP